MGTKVGENTFILFPKRNFFDGIGTLVDVSGALSTYNYSNSPSEADYLATSADWRTVGSDLVIAIESYKQAYEQQKAAGFAKATI